MKTICLWANLAERVACRPRRAMLILLKRDALHTHSMQTGEQECRAEPLAIDLAIYLVGRFLDSKLLQHFRKLFVTDAAPHHLDFYHFLRGLLPSFVRLSLRDIPARRSAHCYSLAFKWPSIFSYRYFLTTIFSRIRLMQIPQHYTSSAKYFGEKKLLTKTLPSAPVRENGIIFLTTIHAGILLPSHGGTK